MLAKPLARAMMDDSDKLSLKAGLEAL